MPQFLTTSGTSHLIENVIIKAKTELVLITPYLKLSRILSERLTEADHRGVRIQLVYGKSELDARARRQLDALTNLELLYLENLHAKCYLNENVLVVSSMNLYEFSEKNNREMGIVLTRQEDAECFADALAEAHSILAAARVMSRRRDAPPPAAAADLRPAMGTPAPVVTEPTPEVPPGKRPYDAALVVQWLFELLKQQPGLGDAFTLNTKPHLAYEGEVPFTLTAQHYPRRGIHLTFGTDARFDFEYSNIYQMVKEAQRDEVDRLLSRDYRCYWNHNVVQIYAAKDYERTDEHASAAYFLKAIVGAAALLKGSPSPVHAGRTKS